MGKRRVDGLVWAMRSSRPGGLGTGHARGAKAAGMRYERQLARVLAQAEHGSWFKFQDRNGIGFCQTDLLADWEGSLVVLEAKYTWTPEAHEEICQLYLPVIGKALRRPVIGLVVCKHLVTGMPKHVAVTGDLGEALLLAKTGGSVVWHWIEQAAKPKAWSGPAKTWQKTPSFLEL